MVKLSDVIPQKYYIYIPDKAFLRLTYFQKQKKVLNLRNPKTYSEKQQWIKIYGRLERFSKYADKYEVRHFIKRAIGEKYLIPIYGCWDSFEEIPFDTLPKQFVLKATHGAGYNFICKDKSKINMNKLRAEVNRWLSENFYDFMRETQYKSIKPRIICEKYMVEASGDLRDYKFYCFNGKPEVMELHSERTAKTGGQNVEMYDMKWNRLNLQLRAKMPVESSPRPRNFDDMLRVVNKLAKGFPHVRVDLYLVKGKVYFGELTFTAGGDFYPFIGETDVFMGDLMDLSGYK